MPMMRTTNDGLEIHPSITEDRLLKMLGEDDMRGFCLACGEDADGVEPDAERYKCEACGAKTVYGAEQLLLHTFA